jgi:hypothetical protein
MATQHDLISHLAKLPGFDHRGIAMAMGSPTQQRIVLWRARPLEGDANVVPMNRLDHRATPPTLH